MVILYPSSQALSPAQGLAREFGEHLVVGGNHQDASLILVVCLRGLPPTRTKATQAVREGIGVRHAHTCSQFARRRKFLVNELFHPVSGRGT